MSFKTAVTYLRHLLDLIMAAEELGSGAGDEKRNLVITAPPQGLFLMAVGYGEFPYLDLEQKQLQSFP